MTSVTVRSGDSMWAIAKRAGVSLDALIAANPQIKNPNLIHPGESLSLPGYDGRDTFEAAPPPPSSTGSYRVQVGDNLSRIAQRAGVSLNALIAANPQLKNPNLIYAGQLINLPTGGRVPEAPKPVTKPGRASNPFAEQFAAAAEKAGVPVEWATNAALVQLVNHESSFRPEAKNPHSTAFGLFQFLGSTWESYLPEVAYGNTDPYWQAVGGFRYIEQRYGTPERAWAFWQATVNRNVSIAPADLQGQAQYWIDHNYGGY